MSVTLEVRDLSVRFGGIRAVSGVSLAVGAGEILSIIGPNGAGKTTIFNVVTGLHRPTAGEVRLRGRPISASPASRARPDGRRADLPEHPPLPRPHGRRERARRAVRTGADRPRGRAPADAGVPPRPPRDGRAGGGPPGRRRAPEAGATSWPGASPTATRSASSWRARSQSSRACCCSTSRRRA